MKAHVLKRNFRLPGAMLSLSVFLTSQCLAGSGAGIFSDAHLSPVNYFHSPHEVKTDCKSLRSWSGNDARILLAANIPDGEDSPAYCDVLGHIQSNIKFRMFIPAKWNGRFFMVGNGGLAGDDLLQPEYPQHLKKMKAAVRHGFATVMTDSGHSEKEEPGGSFAHNNFSAEIDFAFRAIHVVSQTAKSLISEAYQLRPRYSYFDGCSGGGRQGLMSVQRYPEDFNGVVAGAPAFNHTALSVARMLFNPVLKEAGISSAQVKTLGKIVLDNCDAADGAADGLIENPLNCQIDFEKQLPRCGKNAKSTDCFRRSQVKALKLLHSDIHVKGKRLQPGFPLAGDRSGANGWDAWLPTSDSGKFDFGLYYSEELLRYIAFDKDDPGRSLTDFDVNRDMENFGLAMRLIDATETDISEFRDSGGKLLMYMGWQDLAFSPGAIVEYYEALREKDEKSVTDYARLFMVPGMYHCFGGPGPNKFDYMSPMITWVEKNIAPDKIIGQQSENNKVTRTHPLCPWPQTARYSGHGSLRQAENYQCVGAR